jgi:hypothetical protein
MFSALESRSSKIKARSYHSCASFERDLALVVSNCRAYNEPESVYCTAATELESWGAKLFEHLRDNDMLPPDDPDPGEDTDEDGGGPEVATSANHYDSNSNSNSSDDDSSSTDSEDEDEDGRVAGARHTSVPVFNGNEGGESAGSDSQGWRQSAAAFLHTGIVGDASSPPPSPAAAAAATSATAGANAAWGVGSGVDLHGGASSSSENSSDDSDSDSSDDGDGTEEAVVRRGENASWGAPGGGPFTVPTSSNSSTTAAAEHRPRFTLGPKAASAPAAEHGATAPAW